MCEAERRQTLAGEWLVFGAARKRKRKNCYHSLQSARGNRCDGKNRRQRRDGHGSSCTLQAYQRNVRLIITFGKISIFKFSLNQSKDRVWNSIFGSDSFKWSVDWKNENLSQSLVHLHLERCLKGDITFFKIDIFIPFLAQSKDDNTSFVLSIDNFLLSLKIKAVKSNQNRAQLWCDTIC